MPEKKCETSIRKAIRYLRSHALAAHRLGDGFKVSHLASTAIRRATSLSDRIDDKRIIGEDLFWGMVLGLYWTVDDHFGYVIERSLQQCSSDGLDQVTRDLISMLAEHVEHPHADHDWTKFTYPTSNDWDLWVSGPVEQSERLIGYTFLIELAWYDNPEGDAWRDLLTRCATSCHHDPWEREFESLRQRLDSQRQLFRGEITLDGEVLASLTKIEVELLKGWKRHFDFEHAELLKLLECIRPLVSVNSSEYPSYFSLVHNSRFFSRNEEGKFIAEDQFISLPRFRHVVSNQPAHVISDKREQEATDAAKELAIAGFSGDAPSSKRWTRFRMAMLIQLQGLRSWDLGDWFRGLSIRADARIELAKFGYHSMVLDGYLDLLLSRGATQLDKKGFYREQFRLADWTTEEQRSDFIAKLLLLPKRYWRGVAEIARVLSDAIPNDNISQLIKWSLNAEKQLSANDFGVQSLLGMWDEIIGFTDDPESIVQPLAPAIIRASRNPMLWQDLHNLFCQCIRYGAIEDGRQLLAALESAQADAHFAQFRFSIAFNTLSLKPELASKASVLLKNDTNTSQSPYQWLLLSERIDMDEVPRPNVASKKALRSRLLDFLEQRSDLSQTSISLMGTSFHREFRFYKWNRSDRILSDSLCSFVADSNILLTDKIDALQCLQELVTYGPLVQTRRIVKFCLGLLHQPIPGRAFGFEQQGPMSNLRVNSNTNPSLFRLLLDVINAGLKGNEPLATEALLDWLPKFGLPDRTEFAPRVLRLLFALIRFHATEDGNVASILVGHVEAVFGASLLKSPAGSICVFQDLLLSGDSCDLWNQSDPNDLWRKTLLSQWSNHLARLSGHLDPNVRRCVALATVKWVQLKLENHQLLIPVLETLRNDPRDRVRNASNGDERQEA